MKKLITLVAFFSVTGLSAFAGTAPTEVKSYKSQNFNYGLSFSKIVVEDDIDLVIYENASTNIQFDGKKEDIANVEWKVKNGTLYIKSRNGSLKNKVIVTIDVAGLSEISLEGHSSVRSLGNLNSPKLNVFMKSGCFVSIKNYGAIAIINTDDTEMNFIERSGDISVG
jgi:hypothetical protein